MKGNITLGNTELHKRSVVFTDGFYYHILFPPTVYTELASQTS
jgi:hypothetical protein